MKKVFIAVVAAISCLLSSCTIYKSTMSEASQNPLGQKLPKMDIEFYANNVRGANVDFIKNIILKMRIKYLMLLEITIIKHQRIKLININILN